MQKKLRQIFSGDATLTFLAVGCAVAFILNLIDKLFAGMYSFVPADAAFILCVIFLYRAHKKRKTDLQKGLLGAIMMWYLYDEINFVVQGIIMNESVYSAYDNPSGRTYLVLSLITFILYAALFVNYFIISGDRRSRPSGVFINQVLVVLIAVISLVTAPFQLPALTGIFTKLESVTWHIGLSFMVLMLASYETRLEVYKTGGEEQVKQVCRKTAM